MAPLISQIWAKLRWISSDIQNISRLVKYEKHRLTRALALAEIWSVLHWRERDLIIIMFISHRVIHWRLFTREEIIWRLMRRNSLTIVHNAQERKILKPRSGEKISGHWRDLIRRHRKKNMFISHTQNIAQWAQSIELSLQLKMVTNSIGSNSVQESKVLKKSKSREESRKKNIWR